MSKSTKLYFPPRWTTIPESEARLSSEYTLVRGSPAMRATRYPVKGLLELARVANVRSRARLPNKESKAGSIVALILLPIAGCVFIGTY